MALALIDVAYAENVHQARLQQWAHCRGLLDHFDDLLFDLGNAFEFFTFRKQADLINYALNEMIDFSASEKAICEFFKFRQCSEVVTAVIRIKSSLKPNRTRAGEE